MPLKQTSRSEQNNLINTIYIYHLSDTSGRRLYCLATRASTRLKNVCRCRFLHSARLVIAKDLVSRRDKQLGTLSRLMFADQLRRSSVWTRDSGPAQVLLTADFSKQRIKFKKLRNKHGVVSPRESLRRSLQRFVYIHQR